MLVRLFLAGIRRYRETKPDPAALVLFVVLLVTKTAVMRWSKMVVSTEESVRRDSSSAALKRLASAVRFRPWPPLPRQTLAGTGPSTSRPKTGALLRISAKGSRSATPQSRLLAPQVRFRPWPPLHKLCDPGWNYTSPVFRISRGLTLSAFFTASKKLGGPSEESTE
jgi:hypothetical protein